MVEKWGTGSEELQEMRENLSNMVSELSPHQSSDSDSDLEFYKLLCNKKKPNI